VVPPGYHRCLLQLTDDDSDESGDDDSDESINVRMEDSYRQTDTGKRHTKTGNCTGRGPLIIDSASASCGVPYPLDRHMHCRLGIVP
jgi:hypothetical protein